MALSVRELSVCFGRGAGAVQALDRVSLEVAAGEVLALVGASGSGKSTLARAVVGLVSSSGEVRVSGQVPGRDLASRRRVQLVFQDPFASLNPVHDVAHHLERPLKLHRRVRAPIELLQEVGLTAEHLHRFPHELSGGQRQRVAIARALAPEPEVLLADEPTSMLDVELRGEVLRLLRELARSRGLAVLLVTHDLGAVEAIADRVAVLNEGRLVEVGPTATVLSSPEHPYTRELLSASRREGLR